MIRDNDRGQDLASMAGWSGDNSYFVMTLKSPRYSCRLSATRRIIFAPDVCISVISASLICKRICDLKLGCSWPREMLSAQRWTAHVLRGLLSELQADTA